MTTTTRHETDPTMPGVNGDDVADTGTAALEAAGVDPDSLRHLFEEGQKFLRERPAAALGGAFAVGLVFGRLWKIRVLRLAVPVAAFAAGYAAEKLIVQSEESVLAT